ncbi:cell wall proline rich protein [Colletotrichum karsti]|uniref:Cell wall proline rich protein n=1 Tax=Colletotrichum karsti TaxID=1095194 RepID=A0A9P6ICL4_9PEZI|nr:cell wall proline rich protein [Colletotrichum karsti]KAF9879892.1 cell wall proline rich protein [Colletotrichum karsti]
MPPLPNPPFVFPARPSSASAPSSFSRATGRRPLSAIEIQDRSSPFGDTFDRPSRSPALPNFTFNPGASLSPETALFTPPPLSPPPVSPRLIPSPNSISASRPGHGHRRGGSEFVGGSIRSGDSIVASTSPTRPESGFAPGGFQLPPPKPPGRRGHQHRRSAALSGHDLSLILQPPASGPPRGSSAPTSPADYSNRRLENQPDRQDERTLKYVESEPSLKVPRELHTPSDGSASSSGRASPVARPVTRARVGFSDTLEFIPRPLSMVSSDTSSTVTARPGGHSVSGSISSIISIPTLANAETEPVIPLVLTPSRQTNESRPSTAGAVLERSQSIQSVGASPRRRNSIPTLINVPEAGTVGPPMPSPSKTPKRWSFFGLDPFAAAASPLRARPVSSSSSESASKPNSSASSSSEHISESFGASEASDPHSKDGRKSKKKKKVKNWAGSILTRKDKRRSKKCKDLDLSGESVVRAEPAEEKEEVFLAEPEIDVEPVTPTLVVTDSSSQPQALQEWKPRPVSAQDDTSFPMIDLDAALGPFNTPLPNNPEWDAAQKAGSSKRQLHSAQGMKGFSGPGMHYHRRAESAPEMVPFEGARFGIHRFGSSSTMADVFEEDEEDDENGVKSTSQSRSAARRAAARQDSESSSDEATPPAVTAKNPMLGLNTTSTDNSSTDVPPAAANQDLKKRNSMKSERSVTSLHELAIPEEPLPEMPDIPEFRTTSLFHDKAESTGSETPSPRRILASKDLAPVDVSPLHLPTPSNVPVSPYSMSHASSFPSPRSPMSYDAQRISTAPSSVNEENNFQSLLLGEPGPEVRLSVDIPSLTSSHSTMTRDSSFVTNPQFRPDSGRTDQQRPVSVSSAAFGRRRSSLASLSRLISSSHGERSKLSMEVSYDGETEKKHKSSKSKRLSRMMRFWKPKEDNSA